MGGGWTQETGDQPELLPPRAFEGFRASVGFCHLLGRALSPLQSQVFLEVNAENYELCWAFTPQLVIRNEFLS